MKKYLNKDLNNEFLLSLLLCDGKTDNEKIKKLYSISNNVENNYQVFKIKKRNGKLRTIYSPNYNLKQIQKNILKNILEKEPVSKYAKAYVPGISLNENAKMHINKKVLLKLDIKDFFPSITFTDVLKNCFSYDYFPNSVAVLLTKLCTYYDYLPQGAPTSSYISNLVMKEFDEVIGEFCEKNDIAYSRYSDDLTFSGDFDYKNLIRLVNDELLKRGFLINKEKTLIISNKSRQVVTGIVVNKKMQTASSYRKKIRQEMYYIKKYGLSSHLEKINIKNKEKYFNSLRGRINFCLQVNPMDQEMIKYKNKLNKICVE